MRQRQADYIPLSQEGGDISLLRQLLQNIAETSERWMKRLSLEVVAICDAVGSKLTPRETTEGTRWTQYKPALEHKIMETATATFLTSVTALSTSKLMIENVSISRTRPASLQSGLPCDALAAFTKDPQNIAPFTNVKSLHINVADKLKSDIGSLEYEGTEDNEVRREPKAGSSQNSRNSGRDQLLWLAGVARVLVAIRGAMRQLLPYLLPLRRCSGRDAYETDAAAPTSKLTLPTKVNSRRYGGPGH
jgi:hypothetical protein